MNLFLFTSDPEIYTIPRVVGILPSDTEFTLQCNARNPLLQEQVFWVPGLASAAMTSGNSFDDLVSRGRSDYTCIVRDPENNQRIAAQLPVYVRSIPGEFYLKKQQHMILSSLQILIQVLASQ